MPTSGATPANLTAFSIYDDCVVRFLVCTPAPHSSPAGGTLLRLWAKCHNDQYLGSNQGVPWLV
jgi:hypothetical protein